MNYTFVFFTQTRREDPYIKFKGERKKKPEKPETYEIGSSGMKEVLAEFQKIVEGKIQTPARPLGHFPNDVKDDSDTALMKNPKIEMTQKSISEVARRIDKELNFRHVIMQQTYYHNLTPLRPSSADLGFNLPAEKITEKIWL